MIIMRIFHYSDRVVPPNSLLLFNVSRAVVLGLSRKLAGVRLNGVRVKDLHGLGKVDRGDEPVDFRVPEVVAEYEERRLDAPRLREADDQLPEVLDPVVHLRRHCLPINSHLGKFIQSLSTKQGDWVTNIAVCAGIVSWRRGRRRGKGWKENQPRPSLSVFCLLKEKLVRAALTDSNKTLVVVKVMVRNIYLQNWSNLSRYA